MEKRGEKETREKSGVGRNKEREKWREGGGARVTSQIISFGDPLPCLRPLINPLPSIPITSLADSNLPSSR